MNLPTDTASHIYFIGIGGISMSGLAQILVHRGYQVSGSDRSASVQTDELMAAGIHVYIGQRAENLEEAMPVDLVVYTAAIHPDNPEYVEAVRRGIPMMTRAELVGEIMRRYRLPIAVAGTHGKTTTTSMVSQILLSADADPTLSIGGVYPPIGSSVRVGGSDIFVTEACEYTNSFLSFAPGIAVILNIEEDHLDFFKDLEDIRHSFRRFAGLVPEASEGGCLVISSEIDDLEELTHDLPCRVVTFEGAPAEGVSAGHPPASYYPEGTEYDGSGCARFTLHRPGGLPDLDIALGVPGRHNVGNAIAAVAAVDALWRDEYEDTERRERYERAIVEGLAAFSGAERRLERKGEILGVTIIDDYAHHPSEMRASLSVAEAIPHKHLYLVFQPHTYSRTKALFEDFALVLKDVEHVILAPVFAARETDTLGVSSDLLAERIRELGGDVISLPSFDEIVDHLLQNCTKGDLLITMGAGDVVRIGEELLGK